MVRMKRTIFGFFVVAFLVCLTSKALYAHGVDYEIKNGKAVTIKVEYDDGEPMNYAAVKIFSPADEKIEHQNGRTDKNGYFSFSPDQTGDWKITVEDGMGHGIATKFHVDETMEVEETRTNGDVPRWYKLIVGISIIWGLAGTFFYFKARKRFGSKKQTGI